MIRGVRLWTGEDQIDNAARCRRVRADTAAVLGLHDIAQAMPAAAD